MESKSTSRVSTANGVVRNAVMAVGVLSALVAGSFGVSGHAEARVPIQRFGAMEEKCGQIQDAYDYWWGQYLNAKTPEAKSIAAQKMNSYVDLWERDCRGSFGSIVYV